MQKIVVFAESERREPQVHAWADPRRIPDPGTWEVEGNVARLVLSVEELAPGAVLLTMGQPRPVRLVQPTQAIQFD